MGRKIHLRAGHAMPNDAEIEAKSEKVGLVVSPTELRALEFIKDTHGSKYDGASSVLRDYSLTEAVSVYRRAIANLKVS